MSTNGAKSQKTRIGLFIIVVVLVLLAGIQLFLSLYLDTYIENRLTSAVSEQTEGQYELKMDGLNLSLWGRKFDVHNIRLHPADTSSTAPKIDMEQFSINNIQLFPYLFRGDIHVGQVQLSGPNISFVQNSPDSLIFLESSSDSSSGNEKSPVIELSQFLIENGKLTYWNTDLSKPRGELNNFHLDISEIRVDSTYRSKAPYFNFSNIQTSSGNIRYELNNNLYAIETNGFNMSADEGFAAIDSLKLIPQLPRYEFSQKVGHQLDRITLRIAGLRLEQPNLEKLKNGILDAERFTIDQAELEVFHSKMLPSSPETVKTFPHMAFKNLKIPISVDTIAINQSKISYTEHLPDIDQPGTLTFADVNATISNVTNDSTVISQGHEIVMDVTTEVMGEAQLDVHIEFPMHEDGDHMLRGTLESMQAEDLNPILEPVGMVRASSGTIHSLQFLMDLGSEQATGWTQLVYSDLKIEVLDAENVNEGGRQRLKTFLANILKVKANNVEEPIRRGEVSMERVHTKSIFSYWWKSLSTGLKDSIGI